MTLTWNASSDNLGGVDYEIHTANHAGFAMSSLTALDVTADPTYLDAAVPEGNWYYRVVAYDGFGNASAVLVRNLEVLDGTPIVDIKPVLGPVDHPLIRRRARAERGRRRRQVERPEPKRSAYRALGLR